MSMVCILDALLSGVNIHTAWAIVLLVLMRRQCESLRKRNSNIAVPLFYLYISRTEEAENPRQSRRLTKNEEAML